MKSYLQAHSNLLSLFIILSLCSCSIFRDLDAETISAAQYLGYQPIDAIPVSYVNIFDPNVNQEKKVHWKSISDMQTVRNLLPLQSAQVAVSKTDVTGKISYSSASLSAEKGSYEVIMDYMKYKVEDVYDKNNKLIGNGRIGVGLRIKAKVVTSKANLNIGSLGQLGLEASANNLSGGISVDIIGIDSENVTNLIPLTSEINQTSIQSALQALASIKSKLWEDKTTITPHLVAIQQSEENKSEEIRKKLTSVIYVHSSYGDLLRAFWKPDGTVNQQNKQKLEDWMKQNNIEVGAGAIAQFLVDSTKEELRKKAVKELLSN